MEHVMESFPRMQTPLMKALIGCILFCLLFLVATLWAKHEPPKKSTPYFGAVPPPSLSENITLEEASSKSASKSKTWWLDSGGYAFFTGNSTISTIQGDLPFWSVWRVRYAISNPADTDNGLHPQNLFRLLTQKAYLGSEQTMSVVIDRINESASENHNESNGVLFMSRYQDADNLYYAGIRVDGYAVIKKKIGGTYYTMALNSLFASSTDQYALLGNKNLIPEQKPIGMRSVVYTTPDQYVHIDLYVDPDNSGNWIRAASAEDRGDTYGGAPLLSAGLSGIRTDFMDVTISDYAIQDATSSPGT